MRLPLIVVGEDGNVKLFNTQEAALQSMEPIDVEQGVYRVFDADGMEYPVVTDQNVEKKPIFGGRWCVVDSHVPISIDVAHREQRREELTTILIKFLTDVEHSMHVHEERRLEKLIEQVWQAWRK